MTAYIVTSTGLLAVAAAFWSKASPLNLVVKLAMLGGAVFGAIMSARVLDL